MGDRPRPKPRAKRHVSAILGERGNSAGSLESVGAGPSSSAPAAASTYVERGQEDEELDLFAYRRRLARTIETKDPSMAARPSPVGCLADYEDSTPKRGRPKKKAKLIQADWVQAIQDAQKVEEGEGNKDR